MVGTISVGRTNNHDTDGVLTGMRWDTLNLTYSFPTSASFYEASYGKGEPQNAFETLNPVQIAAARSALTMISSVTNLNFSEIRETAATHATLRLAMSDTPTPAWTYTPGGSAEAGDVWYGNSSGWYDSPVRGNYAFYAVIHEMAHAVGLKHGHEDGGLGIMTAARDSMEYSVTTYRSYVGADGQYVENETWGFAQTLMMYDIAALQHMYGADFSTNGGNTTYRWDPATGQSFVNGAGQEVPGSNRILSTVWDGGGIDSYDFSNYANNLSVDLRPGEWSKTSDQQLALLGTDKYARGNVANALLFQGDARSLIENATGGSGSDLVVGNTAANVLAGGSGADRLNGLAGADILGGGLGNDLLTGGVGNDVFTFDTSLNRTTNVDRIVDFSVDDTIRLENAVFSTLAKAGPLSPAAFWTGPAAHDADDRILYDSRTGSVLYDADGSGQVAAVPFATLPSDLKMTQADFFIV
jgi:serralysin